MVRVELNSDAVKELLRSPEMMSVVKERADIALSKLGGGYEVTTMTGRTRVNASISAESYAAKRENLENNSILKALR